MAEAKPVICFLAIYDYATHDTHLTHVVARNFLYVIGLGILLNPVRYSPSPFNILCMSAWLYGELNIVT